MRERPSTLKLIAAYAAIYLIWGSTYLGVKVAVETLPPYLMTAARFLAAGSGLYAMTRLRGAPSPRTADWWRAARIGLLVVVVGFGVFSWAQQFLPSSLSAIMAATLPLWMVLLDWIAFRGPRPTARIAIGIAMGFVGIAILAAPTGTGPTSSTAALLALTTLLGASIAYALGSLMSRYSPEARDPLLPAAMQMLAGGAVLLVAGLLIGEGAFLRAAAANGTISARSLIAFGYLTIFGSGVAYSAYIWLLSVDRPARIATYAYVNPVIAVFLGWALLDERITARVLLGGAVILGAVLLIGLATKEETTRR